MTAVAVLGCGLIGSSWLRVFSSQEATVKAWDPDPSCRQHLKTVDRIVVCDSPQDAVAGADLVQESGPEDLDTKRRLYSSIAGVFAPNAILASSTSTLQPTQLQEGVAFADRILIGHPFNPPHILPLVEVVGGKLTAPWAVERAMMLYSAFGKHPIRLQRERSGHLANRLQAALWREAIDAVAMGQASVKDVDAAVTLALGPRWAIMGPFATFDLGGGEGGLAYFFEHLGKPFEMIWDDAHRPALTEALKKELACDTRKLRGGRSTKDRAAERDERLKAILSTKPLAS